MYATELEKVAGRCIKLEISLVLVWKRGLVRRVVGGRGKPSQGEASGHPAACRLLDKSPRSHSIYCIRFNHSWLRTLPFETAMAGIGGERAFSPRTSACHSPSARRLVKSLHDTVRGWNTWFLKSLLAQKKNKKTKTDAFIKMRLLHNFGSLWEGLAWLLDFHCTLSSCLQSSPNNPPPFPFSFQMNRFFEALVCLWSTDSKTYIVVFHPH